MKKRKLILFSFLMLALMSTVEIYADELDLSTSAALQTEIVPDEALSDEALPDEALPDEAMTNNETELNISNTSIAISSESIVVYNFSELKAALSNNNSYVNIFLGADINMEPLGIEIHSSKKRVLISGKNPLDGSGPFTINEYNSLDPVYTIRVVLDSGTKEVIMRDINVTGRNYYGAVCVFDGANNVTVTFENVNYNGPQLTYNRGGTLRVTGNSHIHIIGGNGLSIAQELAEVTTLELGGNTIIDHYSPVLSGLWLTGANTSVKVLSGSNVVWNETGTYMIYQDNLNPASFIMDKGSSLTINTLNGLFFNNSTTYHQFGNVFIDSDAALKIVQKSDNSSAIPIMKIKNSLRISEDSRFVVIAENAPQLLYMTGAVDIIADKPHTFVLYNKASKLIEWDDSLRHNITINSSFINYWNSPCDLAVLGGFNDSPLYRWRKKGGEDLWVDIAIESNVTQWVSSNYTQYDYGVAPSEELLNMQTARILTAGKLPLSLDIVTDTSTRIGGETAPKAALYAIYTDVEGITHTAYGHADHSGAFDIALQNGKPLQVGSLVYVYSSSGYKNVMESTTVVPSSENSLMFLHVPHHIAFPDTAIDARAKLIPRDDADWHIVIGDSRSNGSQWGLYAKLLSPLTGVHDSIPHVIGDAVVFIDSTGNKTVMGDSNIKIIEGIKANETEAVVSWQSNTGIMLNIDTLNVYSDIDYSAQIQWTLIDGP